MTRDVSMKMSMETGMKMGIKRTMHLILLCAALALPALAADNIKINPRLDYGSDSADGALITGDHMSDGAEAGKPNYVIFYGEG